MPLTKSAVAQIGSTTGLAVGSSYSATLDTSSAVAADIELVISAATAPSAGTINVNIYDALDGINFSTDAVYTGYATPRATSYRVSFPIDVLAFNAIKIEVTNSTDQALDITINAVTVSV